MSTEGAALWRESHDNSRKARIQDEERQQKASDLIGTRNGILSKLPTLLGPNGEKTPEYDSAYQQLTQAQQGLGELYHPVKAPGALQKDWHFLLEKMHGITAPKDKTPSSTTSQTPETTLNTPAAPITTPELPAYQQTTPALNLDANLHTHPGSTTTQVPGAAATTLPGMSSVPKGATPTMAVAKPNGLVEAGTIPIWNRPSVLNDDGTHSSELSISIGDDKGNQTLIPLIVDGKFLTPDGKMPPGPIPHNAQEWEKASPEWKALKMQAEKHYKQTGQHLGKFGGDNAEDDVDAYAQVLHNRGSVGATTTLPAGPQTTVTKAPPVPWGQAQVLKQKAAAMQKAQGEAGLLASGAPLSPEQQAVSQANSQAALRWGNLRADKTQWDKDNPNSSKEDRDAIYSQLYEKHIGTTGKGNWETVTGTVADPSNPSKRNPVSYSFDKASNRLTDFNGTPVNPQIASSFIPDPKATGTAAQDLKDYNNDPDPNKGTFLEWKGKQVAGGKGLAWDTATGQVKGGPNGRRYNPWDKDLPPDVQSMFKSQADTLAKKQANALALAAARGSAVANARMIDVQDPNNVGQNIVVPAGLAYKLGYKTPNGAYYAAMTNMLKDATSGPIGNEFVAFGTALQHADQLGRAAVALNNGDSRNLNSIANGLSTAFGDPAVTNFDVISQVYTGEITKAINAGHVTQSELADNHALIPPNASPSQISGAIQNFKTLLNSKINMRVPQIQSALGKFGMATPFTPPGYTPPAGERTPSGPSKKKVSLAKAKGLERYKGMSDDQITSDLKGKNYEVGP